MRLNGCNGVLSHRVWEDTSLSFRRPPTFFCVRMLILSFNSLYLGFFHASYVTPSGVGSGVGSGGIGEIKGNVIIGNVTSGNVTSGNFTSGNFSCGSL